MASPKESKDNRDLIQALATAFDAIGPTNRAEADNELRDAGVDPEAVGQRIEQLARATLNHRADVAEATTLQSRFATRARWWWAAAAVVTLCVVGWALTRDAGGTRMLEAYRERAQRTELAPRQRQLAGGPARANHATSPESEADTQQPAATAAPLTPAVAKPAAPASDDAIGSTTVFFPRVSVGLLGGTIATPAHALITDSNLAGFGSSLSPGLQWAVRNGVQMQIVDAQAAYLPNAYRAATERYAGTVKLGADGRTLLGYVAGLPFPAIDPNDRQAAVKVVWNYEYGPFATDDLSAHTVTLESGVLGQNGSAMSIDQRVVIEAYHRLYYTGRLVEDPRPTIPSPDAVRFREAMYPVREPFDFRGSAFTAIRYTAIDKPDDSWVYVANLRRLRRLSRQQRTEPLFGLEVDVDSLFGFNAQPTSLDWHLIGSGEAFGCMHAENKPVHWGVGSGDFAFEDVWEPRPVYVVQGASPLGTRVLYIDQETWVVLYSEMYDSRGELAKVWLNMFSAPTTPGTNQPIDNPAAVMLDVQRRRATRMAFPNPSNPQSSDWIFNEGGLSEDWFGTTQVIDAAR